MNPKTINPMGYWVLIKDDPIEEKKGSIFLPDQMKDKDLHGQIFGTVVSMGELAFTTGTPGMDDFRQLNAPKAGQRVLFKKYAGNHFVDGEDGVYRMVKDDEIKAIIND